MRIQRLQTRIIVFFVALLALVQVAAFWFVNAANSRNAEAKVAEELNVGQRVFARLLDQNAEKLKLSARVLAADFAFREAIATHDTGTIASVLANHGARIGAGAMVFVDLEGMVVADTLAHAGERRSFEYPELLGRDAPAPAWKCSMAARFSWWRCRYSRPCPSAGWSWGSRSTTRWRAICGSSPSSKCRSRSMPQRAGACSPRRSMSARSRTLLNHMPARSNAASHLVMNIAGVDHQALVIPLNDNQR